MPDHAACEGCSDRCGACGLAACRTHGARSCEVKSHPACERHVATCPSCWQAHCTTHAGRCAAQDYTVCSVCMVKCARCGLKVCRAHGVETSDDAPLGARWLCAGCTV